MLMQQTKNKPKLNSPSRVLHNIWFSLHSYLHQVTSIVFPRCSMSDFKKKQSKIDSCNPFIFVSHHIFYHSLLPLSSPKLYLRVHMILVLRFEKSVGLRTLFKLKFYPKVFIFLSLADEREEEEEVLKGII